MKREVARLQPEWRPAYMRPGFVTFKSAAGQVGLDVALDAIFARAYGVSFGKTTTPAAVVEFAAGIAGPKRLHVWSRAAQLPGDEPLSLTDTAPAIEAELRASGAFIPTSVGERGAVSEAQIGDTVVDVVVVATKELWFGAHTHSARHAPWPGGRPAIAMPEAAPSRAYVKMVEALLWSAAPLQPGDAVLELGSAPGGASYALLERGMKVVGVDTADMDFAVLDFVPTSSLNRDSRFRHVRKKVAQLRATEIPSEPFWIALDVNLHPNDVFPALERVIAFAPERVRGGLLTFKLTDDKVAGQLPQLLQRVRALGFASVRARQLTYGRREIFVYASK